MNADELIARIEASGREAYSYSGRCMYGKQCVGVNLDQGDAGGELPKGAKTDSMGKGMVWYWPDVEWPSALINQDTMQPRRFADALRAQSATNPVGLTNTLLEWQRDLLKLDMGTDAIKADPACRLLVYQIATLFSVDNMSDDLYATLIADCNKPQ